MQHSHFLTDVVIIFGAALLAGWVGRLLRASAMIGFLVAGITIGPAGLRLIAPEDVAQFAELGLVLLLFTIGLELSPDSLVRTGPRIILAAAVQIGVTAVLTAGAVALFEPLRPTALAVIGVAVAMSSTAIVLKQLSERGETDSPTGTLTTGILLLQDVAVIVAMLLLPILTTAGGGDVSRVVWRTLLSAGGMAGVVLVLRVTLPTILAALLRHGGREMLTLFAVLMACAGAWLAGLVGWSGALGSCVAGLLLSTMDVRHQLVAEITPFRNVFNALFFISLGMLVDRDVALTHAWPLLGMIVVTLIGKSMLTALAVGVAGWPTRISVQVGIGLCTVSEFGYVLAAEADEIGLLPDKVLELLIVFAVATMLVGALLVPAAGPIAAAVARRRGGGTDAGDRAVDGPSAAKQATAELRGHVIVVGYGLNGSNLAQVLRATRIAHCVVEMNRSLAARAKEDGAPLVIGDAARADILEHAGLAAAKALVVAINDIAATRRIVAQARAVRPELYVLARTRYTTEVDVLHRLGAQDVIPEEFETSIEIFAHVLKRFAIPDNVIEAQVAMVRAGRYGMLRGQPVTRAAQAELMRVFEATATQTYMLESGSPATGRTIRDLNLRAATGVTIIAVVRGGNPTTNPPADWKFEAGDTLVLVGAHRQLDGAKARLAPPSAPANIGELSAD